MDHYSSYSITRSPFIFNNINFHRLCIFIESLITSEDILHSLILLSNKHKDNNPFLTTFFNVSFHDLYYRHCLSNSLSFIFIIIFSFLMAFHIITTVLSKYLPTYPKVSHSITFVYNVLCYRYLSMILIDSFSFHIVNTTVIQYNSAVRIIIGVAFAIYVINAALHIQTYCNYISINETQLKKQTRTTNSIPKNRMCFEYPFDVFFSKSFDLMFLFNKIVISFGLQYNYNLIRIDFIKNLFLYCYLALVILTYLYYIGNVAILKQYYRFSLNLKINGFRFWLLQMNVCLIILSLWILSNGFYWTLFILSYFASGSISLGLMYFFGYYFLMKAIRHDVFSLHQLMFLLGHNSIQSKETERFVSDIMISHLSICERALENLHCSICALKKASLTLDEYLSLYYDSIRHTTKKYSNRDNQDDQLSFYLIQLYIIYRRNETYRFYQKYYLLQHKYSSNRSFSLILSSVFNFLIQKSKSGKAESAFYKTFFKINKINEALNDHLARVEQLINDETIAISLKNFIDLGSSIINIQNDIKLLEGFRNKMQATAINTKANQDIIDSCNYIFNIVKFSSDIMFHDDYNDIHNGFDFNEEFMELYYKTNKMVLIKMTRKDSLQPKFNFVIVYNKERLYKKLNETNFIKIFPKQFQHLCEEKLIHSLNHDTKTFQFFLYDANEYLIDYQLNFILVQFHQIFLIKGFANYNKEKLILFKKSRKDDEYYLYSFSQRVSHILKIESYLNEYSKALGSPFGFNELFINKGKSDVYYVNTQVYLLKLQRITALFLKNKDNARYENVLNENLQSIINQSYIEATLLQFNIDNDRESSFNYNYKMYILEEKSKKQSMKGISLNQQEDLNSKQKQSNEIVKRKDYGSSSTVNSFISENRSKLNRHNSHKHGKSNHIDDNLHFLRFSIIVYFFDALLILVSVAFMIIESLINNNIKSYYSIYVHEKKIECYLAHMTIQVLMTPCIYNSFATSADDRLTQFSAFLELDMRPYLFVELKEKNRVFNELIQEYNSNVYSSSNRNIKSLGLSKISYAHISYEVTGSQMKVYKEDVIFSEGLKFFENNINQIITYEKEVSCEKRSISVFHSDAGNPYFTNIDNAVFSSYQRSIYEIILNYTLYYKIFSTIKVLLFNQCESLYELNIVIVIAFSILMSLMKMLIIALCFINTALARRLLINNIAEIRDKIAQKKNVEYFNMQIKNIRLLCQLYGKNPVSLMYDISKSYKNIAVTPLGNRKLNHTINPSKQLTKNEDMAYYKHNDLLIDNYNKLFLNDLIQPMRIFLLVVITIAIIISVLFPLYLSIYLTNMRIVIEYSNINSSIEINMFLAGVLTEVMLFQNEANVQQGDNRLVDNDSMSSKNYILDLIQILLLDVAKKDKYRTVYASTLDSLNYVIVTNNCPDTFNKIDDEIIVTIRNRGELDYEKFYVTVCDKFNYNFIDYYYSSYDIEYRLEKFLKASMSAPFEKIFEDLNHLESMKVLSVIIYISRPIMNFFNSQALQDKFIATTNSYVLNLIIGLIVDFVMDIIVFFCIREKVTKRLHKIANTIIIFNWSLQINSPD